MKHKEEKKERDGFISALCLHFKNYLHHVPNVFVRFMSFATLPFRYLSPWSRWKWLTCHQIISVLSVWFQALCLSSQYFLQSIPKCHLEIHLCTTWCFCESNQPLLVKISLILINVLDFLRNVRKSKPQLFTCLNLLPFMNYEAY